METYLESSNSPSMVLLRSHPQVLPEMQWHLGPTQRKLETHGMKPDLPGGPQGTRRSDLWMILIFKQNVILWKVYTVKSDEMEYQILCCYPAKIIVMELVCSTLQVVSSSKLL